MQPLFLNYYQRVMVWNFVGAQSVQSLKEAAVLLRVIEKVRLTDKETADSNFISAGPRISWQLPEAGFGDKVLELEKEEAEALTRCIEGARDVRVADAEWMLKMVAELSGERKLAVAGKSDGVQP